MNPRTHPRGAPPDFTLPKPNPNPGRMTDALWWLVCMREALEPENSDNGGTYADKAGYHNAGENLPDHGQGNPKTDHSIRRAPDREGPWWKKYSSAHDWTFRDAQRGDYKTIDKYTTRLVNAMRDPNDLRPDDVYAYTLGQMDNDTVVEGYNEYTDDAETSADKTHNWHRHDSFRRNIIGSLWHMWKALTIDMGWTYAEWQRSVSEEEDVRPSEWTTEDRNAVRQAVSWGVHDILHVAANAPAEPYNGIHYSGVRGSIGLPTKNNLQKLMLGPITEALSGLDNVDEEKLGATIATALAPLLIANMPDGVSTVEEIEAALRNVLLTGAQPNAE